LAQGGSIGTSTANFTSNTATGNGGAIYNGYGNTISKITGDFTGNSAVNGGAIYNGQTSKINNINGNFISNTSTSDGGAIYNFGTTTVTGGNFIGNHAAGLGGAIYMPENQSPTTNIVASDNNILFSGNTDSTGSNAIYTGVGSGSTLNINATKNYSVTFNDKITGKDVTWGPPTININSSSVSPDNTGTVYLNNAISYNNVNLSGGTLKLGSATVNKVTSSGDFGTFVNLDLKGGVLNTIDNDLKTYTLTSLKGSGGSIAIDANLSGGTSGTSDVFNVGSSSGTLKISDINIFGDLPTTGGKLNVITGTNNNNITLDVSSLNTALISSLGKITFSTTSKKGQLAYSYSGSATLHEAVQYKNGNRTYILADNETETQNLGTMQSAGSTLNIKGNTHNINGNSKSGIVTAGATSTPQTINIQDVGDTSATYDASSNAGFYKFSSGGNGSFIQLNGADTLNIKNSIISQNKTSYSVSEQGGGAIWSTGTSNLTVSDSLFESNSAPNTDGGVIYWGSTGTESFTNTDFIGNSSKGRGGAIRVANGTTNIKDSTFTSNTSKIGGAIGTVPDTKNTLNITLNIDNTTFSNNGATVNSKGARGGAISVGENVTKVTIKNSTFTGNSARDDAGAIYNSGVATFYDSTFTSNTTATNGGAIFNNGGVSNIIADTKDAVFSGNNTTSGGIKYNAVYNAKYKGKSGTLNLNAGDHHNVIFNDSITGDSGTVNINQTGTGLTGNYIPTDAPTSGIVEINNTVSGNIVNLYGGTLKFGSSTETGGVGNFDSGSVAFYANAGTIDLMNSSLASTSLGKTVTLNGNINLGLDVDLANTKGDIITAAALSNTSASNIVINAINIMSDSSTDNTQIIISDSVLGKAISKATTVTISKASGVSKNYTITYSMNSSGQGVLTFMSASEDSLYKAVHNIGYTTDPRNYNMTKDESVTQSLGDMERANSTLNINGNNHKITATAATINGINVLSGQTLNVNNISEYHGFYSQNGGAINVADGANLTVDSTSFTGNTAVKSGGAIYAGNNITIKNSKFSDNKAGGVQNDIYIADGKKVTFQADLTKGSSIQSGLSGSGNFEKTGTGFIALSGVNKDFTGTLNVKGDTGGGIKYTQTTDGSFVGGPVVVAANNLLSISNKSADNIKNLSGAGTVNQDGAGNLNIAGDNSQFTGVLNIGKTGGGIVTQGTASFDATQSGNKFVTGTATVNVVGTSSVLTYTLSGDTLPSNINIASNATLKVVGSGDVAINSVGFASASTSNLALTGGADYTINKDLGTGTTYSNISVKDSTIKFNGDRTLSANVATTNSTIDLINSAINNITISNLIAGTDTTKLTLDLKMLSANSASDTLTLGSTSSGTVDVSALNITDDNGLTTDKTFTVLQGGSSATLSALKSIILQGNNVYDYAVSVSGNTVRLVAQNIANADSLYKMNNHSDTRGFNVLNSTTYNIGRSLSETLAGEFTVSDTNKNTTTISGKLVDITVKSNDSRISVTKDVSGNITACKYDGVTIPTDKVSYNATDDTYTIAHTAFSSDTNGSFFKISSANEGVKLHLDNVTFADAYQNGTGSVVSMDNANSTLDVDSVDFKNNKSTGNGGALYLNNAKSAVVIKNSGFSNNSSTSGLGGAIYSNVDLDITDSSFSGNTANGTKNDIYLNGKTIDFTTNDDTSSAISSGIQGTGTLNKLGTGTLNVGGINSGFTGAVDIQNGTLSYKATDSGDSFFGGGVNLYNGTVLNIDDNGKTDLTSNGLNSQTTGAGTINKSGSKILTLNGQNAGYTGQFNINGGEVDYKATNSGDTFVGGNVSLASGTTLKIDTNGNTTTQNIAGDLTSEDNTAQFIINDTSASKNGILTLLGDNSKFTGTTDIKSGILAVTQSDTTKYTTGSTVIETSGILDYTSDTNEALTVSGAGKIVKAGTGTTTLKNTDFAGTADVNGGVLSVTPTSQTTAGKFNIAANVASGAELDYNSTNKSDSYTLDNTSTIKFNTGATGATVKFDTGNFALNSDIANATGNNIIFNNALVNVKDGATYNGNYTLNGNSTINMWDEKITSSTFDNLTIGSTSTDYVTFGVDVDLTYDTASGQSPKADMINVNNGSGKIKLTTIGIDADNGIFADSSHTKQVQVINNATSKSTITLLSDASLASGNFELAKWSTNVYEYNITAAQSSTDPDNPSTYDSIKFVADKVADADSLYKMNKTSDVRGFSMIKDGKANTYYIGRSLSDTAAGNFTVSDTSSNSTFISGSLHNIVISQDDSRIEKTGTTYKYDGVDVTGYITSGTDASGNAIYTITPDAFTAGHSTDIKNGSFFRIVNNTDFTLKNVTVEDAYSASDGSIIYANNIDSYITVKDAILTNSKATNGGAIYNNDIDLFQINGSTISSNVATANGGALYNNTAYGTIYIGTDYDDTSANTFTSNKAKNGGAIYNTGGIGSYKTTFNGNSATEKGGALYNTDTYISSFDTFTNNTATNGSAIYNTGDVSLLDPTFTSNTGTSYIDNTGNFSILADKDLTINNNTTANITNNYSLNLKETSSTTTDTLTIKDAIIGKASTSGTSGTINTNGNVNLTNAIANQAINVNSGTLSLGDSTSTSALSNLTNDKLTVNSGTTANIYNTNYTTGSITDKGTLNLNNNTGISTDIAVNIEGTSTSTLNKDGLGEVVVSGNQSNYLGQTNVNKGTLTYSAASSTDKFFGGKVNVGTSSILNINDNGKTDLIANGLTSTDKTAIINKSGSKILTLNGQNAGYTGQFNINGGEVDYKATNSTDTTFLGGGVKLANGTTLKIDPNGVTANQTVNGLSSDTNSTAQFIINDTSSSHNGIVNLTGANSGYTGTTDIQSGILAYTSGTGNSYVGGTTKIGANGILKYTNNTTTADTIGDITGTGILNKEGTGALTTTLEKTFTGTANVNGGTLTVNNTADNTTFNNNFNIASNSNLVYNASSANNTYTLDSTSNVKFNSGATDATATFNKGTYNLNSDLANGSGNTVNFKSATVNLGTTNYSGNYSTDNASTISMIDNATNNYTFNKLSTDNTDIKLDISLNGTTSDKLISTNAGTNSTVKISSVDNINVLNKTSDDGTLLTRNYTVLGDNLTFGTTKTTLSNTIKSEIYNYTASTQNGILTLTATALSKNSLYILNHERSNTRTFNFIGTTPYYIGQNLDKTLTGTLNVLGSNVAGSSNTIIAKADSSATTGLSMFELVNPNTTLNIKDLTIQDAKGTQGSVINATATDSKISIENTTMQNNTSDASGVGSGMGGAIYNAGTITKLSNSVFTSNTAKNGGAICNETNGKITSIDNDTFKSNTTVYHGGAISNVGTIGNIKATFGGTGTGEGNIAGSSGGAIFNEGSGTIESINNSTFIANSSNLTNGAGGAIVNGGTITNGINSVFTSNTATRGGAIYNNGTISGDINSTFTSNEATTTSGANVKGGAIYNDENGKIASINGSTFTSNKATDGMGGAIYNAGTGTISTINNSTFKSNSATDGGAIYNIGTINNINNSTFEKNSATNGSAIFNAGTLTLLDSTFTSNSGTSYIYNNADATLNLEANKDLTINNNVDSTTSANITNDGTINLAATTGAMTIKDEISSSAKTKYGTLNSDGTVNLTNKITNQNMTANTGTLSLGDSASTSELSNLTNDNLTVNSGATTNIYNTSYTTGSITDKGTLNLNNNNGVSTTVSANISGSSSTLNKVGEGTVTLTGDESGFTGETNVNAGTLTYTGSYANSLSNSSAINVVGSTLNYNLSDTDLTLDNTKTNLKNGGTFNLNNSGTITLNSNFLTTDGNSNNVVALNNGTYVLNSGSYSNVKNVIGFNNATVNVVDGITNYTNDYKLSSSTLDLTQDYHAINNYTFNSLDAETISGKGTSNIGIDVNLVYDPTNNVYPTGDTITVTKGATSDEYLNITKLFIVDDNGAIATAPEQYQKIKVINDASQKLHVATANDTEILSWATNIYRYGLDSAQTNYTADSIKISAKGPSSTDTLRDLNRYNISYYTGGNRGFSFVGNTETDNSYHIYRDLDTTSKDNFTIIGKTIGTTKSLLSGELKDLTLDKNNVRLTSDGTDYYYTDYYDNGSEYKTKVTDYITPGTDAKGNAIYTITPDAFTAGHSKDIKNGSFFELQAPTNLDISKVSIENAKRYDTSKVKDGSVIYTNNANSTVTLTDVDFKNDEVLAGNGGAIANEASKSFTLTNSTISGNKASGNGGAIYNTSTGMTLTNITADGNSATGTDSKGGAIYTNKDMTIVDSSFGTTKLNTHKNGKQNDIYIDETANVTFQTTENNTSTIASGLAGTGSLTKTDKGTLNLSGDNSGLTGKFAVDEGTVNYTQTVNNGFVSGDVAVNGALNISNSTADDIKNVSGTGNITKSGVGSLDLLGKNSGFTGALKIADGALNYEKKDDSTSYISGSTVIDTTGTLNYTVDNTLTDNLKKVSGSGNFNKLGLGTVNLTGDNSGFTGATKINAGDLNYTATSKRSI
jgi:predicted outer membrane repeat protein/autotransporter-associated beta strand protein